MNISGLQYNLNRKTLEIYISGCYGMCPGCHNSDLWSFEVGKHYTEFLPKITKRIKTGLVECLWILGGDPMDQNPSELMDLIKYLKLFNLEMWLWTRYELNEIPEIVKNNFNYIKSGEYQQDLPEYIDSMTGIKLASNNQKIILMKK